MVVETVFSRLTVVCDFKWAGHWVWEYFEMSLGDAMALFNLLATWDGLPVEENGFAALSIAWFNL